MASTDRKATRAQIKTHNRRLILRTIYDHSEISRAEIARITHLTRPTVSSIVAELIAETLVAETGQTASRGGKPAILLRVVPDSYFVIGLDLADSEFRGCLVNLRGEIRHRTVLPVTSAHGDEALALVFRLVEMLIAASDSPILGIGIGAPGLIDAEQGIVRRAVNLNWKNLPLRQLLAEKYHLPTYIANDSQAATLAEYTFGHHPGVSNLVVVKIGVGVSSGIIINGQLFHGDGSGAGEIGHVRVEENGVQCRCGNYGCLETVVSSPALLRQIKNLPQTAFPTLTDNLTLEEIVAAADMPAVQNIIRKMGDYLGQVLAAMVGTLNIHQFVIGGTVAQLGDALLQPTRRAMDEHAPPFLIGDTKLAISKLGQDIVVLGASALVLANELGLV